MRLVVQRVSGCSVSVREGGSKKVVGKIGKGLFILVGVGQEDSGEDAQILAEKVSKLRIMSDENDKMNLSLKDVNAQVLAVSQFTLYADTTAGNRPSFIKAADPDKAKKVYQHFVDELSDYGIKVETGKFGAYMDIEAQLDGPVTIVI